MVRIGVIGPGGIAKNLHLPSIEAHPEAQTIAICGRNQENAHEVAKKFSIPSIYADYREMLNNEALDAVLVLTPDDCHYPMTMAAIETGCHVLCEKPLAKTTTEAEAMLEAATKKGLIHMTFFNQRELPHFAYAKRLIDDGFVGKPLHFACRFTTQRSLQEISPSWHYDARKSTGALGNIGSHLIDMLRWFLGEVDRLTASIRTLRPPAVIDDERFVPVNDSALLHLEFKNGAHGTIYVGTVSATARSAKHYRIEGELGALEIDQSYSEPISQIRGGKVGEHLERISVPAELCGGAAEPVELADYIQFVTSQPVGTRAFVDAILENRQLTPSFADGVAVQRIIDAALKASETHTWVSMSSK